MRHPFPYQELAIDWLAFHSRAILALEMGLGKTGVAIRAADQLRLRKILVICPAVAITNWIREFALWQTFPRTVGGVYNSRDRPGTDVVIVNYDKLSRNSVADLLNRKWDLVIGDEGHALKTASASRTRKFYGDLRRPLNDPSAGQGPVRGQGGLVSNAANVWILTATPIPNHLGEIWTHIRALMPQLLPLGPNGRPLNYWGFVERYCECRETPFGIQILGNKKSMLPEVRSMLRHFVLRVKKVDVLPDLPPIRFVTTVIEASHDDTELAEMERHPDIVELRQTLEAARAAVELREGFADREQRGDLLDTLANRPGHIATLRRMTSLVKVGPAIELLKGELESGALDKVIVFAVHREAVDRLADGLKEFGAVKLYGGTPQRWRQEAIDAFQNESDTRVFVGQIQACGTAINLTAASDVVFVEASWVPSDNAQAASRAHRIGTRSSVLVRFLALAGSVDELVQDALARKTAAINQVLN